MKKKKTRVETAMTAVFYCIDVPFFDQGSIAAISVQKKESTMFVVLYVHYINIMPRTYVVCVRVRRETRFAWY